ncbi:helix-turn-helix transcriptional regulator [Streptomyces antimicrobicus]|uniref:Helix-turn-helix domain-containing protein n=1 Tax=Streptomyces antimicrobicus TaxID=2883108 RepID=A0ABS8BBI0_9ACTN|nr:helix-turn-helix domain-containing protein [Streptomyces antimicrobicus]MCB5181891.1 helix-turn-helix domain-containing protein [Streptomyces antimicrobicus]
MSTAPVPGFHNPEIFEVLPNACLSPTARDVLDILTARQEPGGLVRIRQQDIAERLGLTQSVVSRAIGQLRDKGILSERQRKGTVLIHPLLAGYESLAHMINHLKDPDTFVWPLNFPTGDIRPPRARDARTGTDFDPDPDGGEDGPVPETRPTLRLAG